MAQVSGFQPPVWEAHVMFLAANPTCRDHLGSEPVDAVSLTLPFPASQIR